MEEITLECEFITPAFIYGDNGNLEIRTTSIKGLMRFWWRAIQKEFTDLNDIRNEEARIFGGKAISFKDGKKISEEFLKAKVQMRAYLVKDTIALENELNIKIDKYLYYSISKFKDLRNRKHFKQGTRFRINFKYEENEYIIEYLKALNALQLFGGIGLRSRRCGGNFVVRKLIEKNSINYEKFKDVIYVESEGEDLVLHYRNFIKKIISEENNCIYSNISSNLSKCYLIDFNDKSNLDLNSIHMIDKVGKIYEDTRKKFNKSSNYKRGDSPLIVKLIRYNKELRVLLIELYGRFNYKEIEITQEFLIKCLEKIKDMEESINE